jgi:putative ABC transport system substrate-binding protein
VDGQYEQLGALVADLISRHVAVIVAAGNAAAQTAKAATGVIPIVFTTGDDPIRTGLVDAINRPGSNITGATLMAGALPTKWLELLHELVPAASNVFMLVNPNNANAKLDTRDVQAAGRTVGLHVKVLVASNQRGISSAFTNLSQQQPGAIVVNSDAFFLSQREHFVELAARFGIPTVYFAREFVEAGGLISYGGRFADLYRVAGVYAGRILRGEKPSDLPVVQPTKFELMINLKTAKTLGLELPPTLLARADEVIE